jgi:choline dehydrogenase-like flavoprotein
VVLSQPILFAGIVKNCGTVRFGTDPSATRPTSTGKAHDLDNLYVVDTSFFHPRAR